MKIGIASHIVLDTIKGSDGMVLESMGGPPCYCGITARRFGLDVELATSVGGDFPEEQRNFLRDNNITLKEDWHVARDAQTTRFRLEVEGDTRRLFLQTKCEPISERQVQDAKVDCWLVSPVIDEVPPSTLAAIKKNRGKKNFVMLDPQGYMRRTAAASDGSVISLIDKLDIDLAGITALKVDRQEMAALTGGAEGLEGMQALQAKGIEFVVATEHRVVHLLHKDMHYWIKLRDIDTSDSTGAGDILAAGFACGYVKEKDPLWAICFGAGALRAALETKEPGLAKIPPMNKIESSASYFYNTVSFKRL
ncbi:sugar kinase, ribokinase [Candidatus Nitrososphaera evergladensis SR1]|uniref:Sugar kinase, ribokinase n=1 Tax=Candidatus Nitrososphaera evergladensis SR1 TaxID=1459636 RepID=A0A075MR04_9ARCH|nr:PfkB family carbohydrate kinase [Candidatus Nitrososphaera evergladensis]AIF83981.1 sugar kinase, ribokinase [Candidatus Nitrososphaera evergladensis SR1]